MYFAEKIFYAGFLCVVTISRMGERESRRALVGTFASTGFQLGGAKRDAAAAETDPISTGPSWRGRPRFGSVHFLGPTPTLSRIKITISQNTLWHKVKRKTTMFCVFCWVFCPSASLVVVFLLCLTVVFFQILPFNILMILSCLKTILARWIFIFSSTIFTLTNYYLRILFQYIFIFYNIFSNNFLRNIYFCYELTIVHN